MSIRPYKTYAIRSLCIQRKRLYKARCIVFWLRSKVKLKLEEIAFLYTSPLYKTVVWTATIFARDWLKPVYLKHNTNCFIASLCLFEVWIKVIWQTLVKQCSYNTDVSLNGIAAGLIPINYITKTVCIGIHVTHKFYYFSSICSRWLVDKTRLMAWCLSTSAVHFSTST